MIPGWCLSYPHRYKEVRFTMENIKILIFGAHPDDPESGCGGLIANAVDSGHDVHCLYATTFRNGREFFNQPEREVRKEEAIRACKILGVTWEFLDFPSEGIDINVENRNRITRLIEKRAPDVLVAHWPVDTNPDHRAVATLALEAFLELQSHEFYYFEVLTGQQSLRFMPTHYIDISLVYERKRRALLCHRSQNPEDIWERHEAMHHFRGLECAVERAEAYVKVDRGSRAMRCLPGLA